jgi:potassium-transporting ATPase KdpC subunit
MKEHILPALRLTLVCLVFFCGVYTLVIWLIGEMAPGSADGQQVIVGGKTVGYALEGQNFSQDRYFDGRPSAGSYNAMSSGGTNKSPYNEDYIKDVEQKIDTFLAHNRFINRKIVPAELITSSASGLDPDISPAAAYVQVPRIAKIRRISASKLKKLVDDHIDKPLLGFFGPERINVLALNIDLDQMR